MPLCAFYVIFFRCPGSDLLRLWSVYRTYVSASAAIDARSFVDNVQAVASSDAANWALRLTSATRDARIINYVCHNKFLLKEQR